MIDEKYILNQIRNKDINAFNNLFCEYYRPLTLFAQQYVFDMQEGEDIVQDIFIHFWENTHRIEIRTSLKSYLYQSIKNRCLNHLRDKKIRDTHNLQYIQSLLNAQDDDIFHDDIIKESLEKAIDMLPPAMGQIMRFKYLDKKKIAEVSNLLSISRNTIKTQLIRGKKILKKIVLDFSDLNVL